MHDTKIIKNLTPPFIFKTLKYFYELIPKYYGLNKLDKQLENYINYDSGYFVELGANDGKSQSNTLYFEKYRKWLGILIEPTPNKFLECINNRSAKSKIFCNACVSFEYKDKFVEILYSFNNSVLASPEAIRINTAVFLVSILQILHTLVSIIFPN